MRSKIGSKNVEALMRLNSIETKRSNIVTMIVHTFRCQGAGRNRDKPWVGKESSFLHKQIS